MTDVDMDSGTETALRGAVRAVRGSQVKLTFCGPAHSTGGGSLHHEVTVAAKRMMVEGVPANVQYDTGAEVCLITTEMVARLGLMRHREACLMELTSALGAPQVISTRRHCLHFKTGPVSVATVLVYEVDNIGSLSAVHDVHTAEHSFPQPGRADRHANWGITSGPVEMCFFGINTAHLHPREERLSSGIKLLHSSVSGNYLLSGTMITDSVVTLTGPLIKYRWSRTSPVASAASTPAPLAAKRVAPVDQACSTSVGTLPHGKAVPMVRATTAHQNYGSQQARGLARARAKMLPNKGTSSRPKTGPIAWTGHRGGPSGPRRFVLPHRPDGTGEWAVGLAP